MLTDLDDRQDEVLSRVPRVDEADVHVACLAFDGVVVAWCDDRFGNFEVFVVDLTSRQLVRVTDAVADDTEVALGAGRLAWSREGDLWVQDLGNGTAWSVDTGPGEAQEPALAGETVAWIRLQGDQRYVMASDLRGGGAHALSILNETYAHALAGEGDLLAWEVYTLRVPGKPDAGLATTVLQAVQGSGPVLNVTVVPDFRGFRGSPLGSDLGGRRIAWLDPTQRQVDLKVLDWPTGTVEVLATKAHGVAVSDEWVVAFDGEAGIGQIWTRRWDSDTGGRFGDAPTAIAALGALAAVAAALRRRGS
jgi:hypothetical protein